MGGERERERQNSLGLGQAPDFTITYSVGIVIHDESLILHYGQTVEGQAFYFYIHTVKTKYLHLAFQI